MPRLVRHIRSDADGTKTICGKEITRRYRVMSQEQATLSPTSIGCPKCLAKAVRMGLIARDATPAAAAAVAPRAPRVPRVTAQTVDARTGTASVVVANDYTGDKDMDDFLSRIGVLAYRP